MIIYKDIVSGDELISDGYKFTEVGNGIAYEVECTKLNVGGESFNTGANESAETPGDDATDDQAQTVLDVVHAFRLNETAFDKKGYLSHLKGYMKAIKEHMKEKEGASDEDIKTFETNAQAFAKTIIAKFKDYEFLVGESMNPDAMAVLLNYREDGVTPYVTYWKNGMSETKV